MKGDIDPNRLPTNISNILGFSKAGSHDKQQTSHRGHRHPKTD